MKAKVILLALAGLLFCPTAALAQPDTTDTRLLQSPAVGKSHIAFVYGDDIWVCDLDGKNVRRLTSHPRSEGWPEFSPDGRTIAYSGQYDAPTSGSWLATWNVYTVPVEGGEPTRLTWHPGWDMARSWTPDGGAVLFSSWREAFSLADQQVFTIPAEGGFPTKLPISNAWEACYSPDGAYVAYTPHRDPTFQWKNYRGGLHSRIWIVRLSDLSVEQIPQPEGRCNDTSPHWMNGTIYFRSDRNGEYNLFSYDTKSKAVRQLTHFEDFPVASLDANAGNIVYEQAGYIHRFDPQSNQSERLKIGVTAELPQTRVRYVSGEGMRHVRNGTISPTGARAVLEFRGEVVTVPTEKGDPRNLTNTTGANERWPNWSPDGKSIAYFSDEGGEYALHVAPADGDGDARVYELEGHGFYEAPAWSPDSKKIAYLDNSWTLYWMDVESGKATKIASEPMFGIMDRPRASWSPDSKWIAYAQSNLSAYRTIHVYSLETGQSHAITDGMSDATEPVFDKSGKYLYFFSSTDAGPVNHGFNLSSRDMRATRSLYVALLRKDTPWPFAPESDEEKAAGEASGSTTEPATQPATKPDEDFRIDLDGVQHRIVPFPLPAGDYRSLAQGPAGQALYLAQQPALPGQSATANLMRYDMGSRKSETIASGVNGFDASADGKKALVLTADDNLSIVEIAPGVDPAKSKLKMEAVQVRVDGPAEWAQIFDEAWRLNRDWFYDPGMHGADWPAMKEKYAQFLPHLTSTADVYRVIRWMLSELSVSHSGAGRFTPDEEPKTIGVGLLGADFEVANGRYRFKKVYGGATWWPEARAPLAAPGVDVKAGEYLLAVQGEDLRPPESVFKRFQNTGNRQIEITVGPNPNGDGSRSVVVQPLTSFLDEHNLRHLDWVEGNRRKVHDATGGRVAYIYVPDTTTRGHAYFKRFFYAQVDKDAVIVDERYNGGGSWADYYLDHLRRPFSSYWALRYGTDFRSPSAAILGPKVMLINENAGSGGDGLPWMFRQLKLGPLIGKRTWGGEVGTTDFPPMLDGGYVSAPNFALWSPGEGWVVENEGVPPDIEVEQWPADIAAGRDPQLEKAIEVILEELKKNPQERPQRPPYPVRARQPTTRAAEGGR